MPVLTADQVLEVPPGMIRALTGTYTCEGCGEEADGLWPAPEEGFEQDGDGPPVAVQTCPCSAQQTEEYPGYSFRTEAG